VVQLPGVGGVRCDGENDGAMCTCIFRLWYEDLNSLDEGLELDSLWHDTESMMVSSSAGIRVEFVTRVRQGVREAVLRFML
jgi:hypothetical protein